MSDRYPIAPRLAQQLVAGRKQRGFSQRKMAERVARSPARIAEMEADLANNRSHRDRLSLLLDLCDSLDLVPVLVHRSLADQVSASYGPGDHLTPPDSASPTPVFDQLFVDLGDDFAADLGNDSTDPMAGRRP